MNLIERITTEMATDIEDFDDQSERIIEAYFGADEAGKELLDTVFSCLCGWQLCTLIKKHQDEEATK